jgi:hypothetical protein
LGDGATAPGEAAGLATDATGLGMDTVGLVGMDGGGLGLDFMGVGMDFLGADPLFETGGVGTCGWLVRVGLVASRTPLIHRRVRQQRGGRERGPCVS